MTTSLLAVSIHAESLAGKESFGVWLTNSTLFAVLVAGALLWLMRGATKNMTLVPGRKQNFVEALVELIYNQVVGMLGPKVGAKAFPLLATIFIFILMSNWMGLLPGVGTIGWSHGLHGQPIGPLSISGDVDVPVLRPPSADLNMNGAIALVFMALWLSWSVGEVGIGGFLKHIFAPKGGLKGFLKYALLPIFLFVGVIEVISIAFRPITLSFRLLGNIVAGESLLHQMGNLGSGLGNIGSFISSFLLQLPFYFMELLVGLLQAMVFTILCTVYLMLSTAHDEEHDEGHASH